VLRHELQTRETDGLGEWNDLWCQGSREIKQTEAGDLLTTNGIDKVIMNGQE